MVYTATEFVNGYGFLAVFIAALTLRSRERENEYHRALHDFAEQVERLLIMLVLVLFGGAIAGGLLASLTWLDWVVCAVILLVVRPVSGLISMLGSPLHLREKLLSASLGIRGIGSFFYIAYGINHGDFGSSERLWAITGAVVLMSVVLHGIAATPLMSWIERPVDAETPEGEEDVID